MAIEAVAVSGPRRAPAPPFDPVRAIPRGDSTRMELRVTAVRAGTTVANTGATLLEQAEAAGLNPVFGCRMGICFSCTAKKGEGTVRNVLTGETSSLPDEEIRICVSTPEGDCSVEL